MAAHSPLHSSTFSRALSSLLGVAFLCLISVVPSPVIGEQAPNPPPGAIKKTPNAFDPLKAPLVEVRDVLPDKPQDYVADGATLLSDEQRSALSTKASELAHRQNVHLYIVTSVYVHGETAQQRSRRLADLWLGPKSNYGAVILYDQGARGKDAIAIACAEDGNGVLVQEDLYRLVINAHRAATGAVGNSGSRVEAAFKSLEMGFRELKPRLENGRWLSPRQMMLIGLVIGTMGLTLLMLWWVRRLERKSDAKNRTSYLFPEISVLPRFGAPCGGGVMAQTEFRNSAPPV